MTSTLPPTQVPANQEYAGDEINALVLDPGSYTTRAGFAGEDTPKSVVPTSYGFLPSGERVFGENSIHLPRPDMEIRNPYSSDGIVEDWDTASKLWEYTITSRLTGARQTPPSRNGLNDVKDENGDVTMEDDMEQSEEQESALAQYPLLMSETPWNPMKAREKTIEIAMEGWDVPAFFLAKNGQLAAYSQGKATALVIDIGHQNTSLTAVWEGMVLRKSLFHTPLAGNWLSDQIRLMFGTMQPPAPLVPHYMIKSKQAVDAGAPSNATYVQFAKPPTESFRRLEEERVLTSFKESVVQAWQGPGRLDSPAGAGPSGYTNMDHAKSLPPKPFEMPDGWNTVFGVERYKVAEGFFDNRAAYTDSEHPQLKGEETIISMANKSLMACDVDTRAHLLNNVILTGAGSLIEKLPERLQSDLQTMYPNPKVRVLANSNSVERKYGAWIGGSVLGSLGTFHQMWISKAEYAEYGASIVEKRCMGNYQSKNEERQTKNRTYQVNLRIDKPVHLHDQQLPPAYDAQHAIAYFIYDLYGPILLQVRQRYDDTSIAIAINAGCDGQEQSCVTSDVVRLRLKGAIESAAQGEGLHPSQCWQAYINSCKVTPEEINLKAVAASRMSEEHILLTAAHNVVLGLQELCIERMEGTIVTSVLQQLLHQIVFNKKFDEDIQSILKKEGEYGDPFSWTQMQAVLGALVAWLDGVGSVDARIAAKDRERFVEIVLPVLKEGESTKWRVQVIEHILTRRILRIADNL